MPSINNPSSLPDPEKNSLKANSLPVQKTNFSTSTQPDFYAGWVNFFHTLFPSVQNPEKWVKLFAQNMIQMLSSQINKMIKDTKKAAEAWKKSIKDNE